MRISSLVAVALLCGCSAGADALPAAEDRIDCALGGAAEFSRECWVDARRDGQTIYLTLRHEDGGFRRLEMGENGRGLRAADGIEQARITPGDNGDLVVAVGADRYILPPVIAGDGAQ